MKVFIVAFAIVALTVGANALTDAQKENIKKFHSECSAVSGVSAEIIAKARKGEFVDDAKFKEHLFCFSKKAGFQNDAGDIQKDVLKAKLGGEIKDASAVDQLIAKCAIQKATPQDTAFETIKCYYNNTPQHISLA